MADGDKALEDKGRQLVPIVGSTKTVSVTKALVADANYAIGDVVSESKTTGTVWLFPGIARNNGGSGYIVKAQAILETTNLTPRIMLFLYKAAPTCELNDNEAHDGVVHADEANYIGKILIPAMETLPTDGGGDSEAVATPSDASHLPLEFECASDADDLLGVAVLMDAVTGEVDGDELIIKLTVEQN